MIRQSVANIDMRDISGKKQKADIVDLNEIDLGISIKADEEEESKFQQQSDFENLSKCGSHK